MRTIAINKQQAIGPDEPCFVIAEIGINHNGSVDTALRLIEEAAKAGCNAVKFQKRTPEICTPRDQWEIMRDTPWGRMSYINYRYKVEFGEKEYKLIDEFSKEKNIIWFASCWDEPSVDFIEKFDPLLYKASSASLTDIDLLKKKKATGKPLILSTGMSTMDEIFFAIDEIGTENIMIAHSTSAYPCPVEQLNLRMIQELQKLFPQVPIGYSGHETGLSTTVAAVTLGARFIERHFTIDRAMWGSDQAASVEPIGMAKLVRDIRDVEGALGDGVKKVYDSEIGQRQKLRRVKEVKVNVENS
jgi:N-acetylneuraminate synthase